jgi:ectoine hydroxylase-related dioxygenase (phytanoyl-CoA dioxygenase family)
MPLEFYRQLLQLTCAIITPARHLGGGAVDRSYGPPGRIATGDRGDLTREPRPAKRASTLEDTPMEATAFNLNNTYGVTPDQCARYRHDGHILLRGVAREEEIEQYRPLITGLVDEMALNQDIEVELDDSGPLFLEVTNLWRHRENIREFVFSRRFARIAATLMGVRGVRLYHDVALVKEPGGKPSPWHKDHYSWPLATHHTIKMWLALSDILPEMGGMVFATASHHGGYFPEVPISYSSHELFEEIIQDHKIPLVTYSLRAGDALFYSGETLHSALANTSTQRREVLAVIYFEDGTHVLAPNHEHRRADLQEFLPGLRGGDIAAGPLTPLLYASEE